MDVLLSTATFIFNPQGVINSCKDIVFNVFQNEFPVINVLESSVSAPIEIPRYIMISHHQFSTVVVTPNMVQLTTKFNENFSIDWIGKCKGYLEKKVDLIFKFFAQIDIKPRYCGLTLNSVIPVEENGADLIEGLFLKRKLISNLPLYDVMLKQSFSYKNKYFINLQIQNQRYVQNQILNFDTPELIPETAGKIGLVIDINDRMVANKNISYISSMDTFSSILIIADDILNFGLKNFVKKGEIECKL